MITDKYIIGLSNPSHRLQLWVPNNFLSEFTPVPWILSICVFTQIIGFPVFVESLLA